MTDRMNELSSFLWANWDSLGQIFPESEVFGGPTLLGASSTTVSYAFSVPLLF